jgi:hypothetical protein
MSGESVAVVRAGAVGAVALRGRHRIIGLLRNATAVTAAAPITTSAIVRLTARSAAITGNDYQE